MVSRRRCLQAVTSLLNGVQNQRTCSTQISGDHKAVQKQCRKLALKILAPVASQLDREGRYPAEQIAALAEHGLMGMRAPAAYGGSDLDMMSLSIAVEELSRCCASTGAIVSIHNALYVDFLATHGSEHQKQLFLTPYTRSKPGAFALTEPEAGSDVANISTIAEKRADDHFVLNGCKTWVTSAKQADIAIVFATLNRTLKHRGITAFLVPMHTDGLKLSKEDNKLGIRAVSTCQMSLTDVVVPRENMIGEDGDGFKMAMLQLNKARIGIASQAVGISQAALDTAVEYALERRTFGKQIKEFQAVKIRLAQMSARIEASRLLVRKAAALCDRGESFIKNSAIAKLVASETANFSANQCIQILGGMGYMKDMPAERYYRDARVTEIYGGVSDIQMMIIADQLLSEWNKERS